MPTKVLHCTVYGCTRRASPGFKRCLPCRQAIRARQKTVAENYRRHNLCPRDGRPLLEGHAHCAECVDMYTTLAQRKRQERRANKACIRCGNSRLATITTALGRRKSGLCSYCLSVSRTTGREDYRRNKKKRLARQKAYRAANPGKQSSSAQRVQRYAERKLERGLCRVGGCYINCAVSKKTGELATMCAFHLMQATSQKAVRRLAQRKLQMRQKKLKTA